MRQYLILSQIIISFLLYFSCQKAPSESSEELIQMELLSPEITGVSFQNNVLEKIDRNLGLYDYFYNGSGCAIGDFNNDGKADLFFAGNDTDNQLYLNKGKFQFKEISKKAGIQSTSKWSTGVTLVDINEDGWLDIYVCNSGPTNERSQLANQLFINNGDLTFRESAADYGIDDASRSTQAVFFDMDKDGDLDLFVMNHSVRNYGASIGEWYQKVNSLSPEERSRDSNSFYRNDGRGKFTEITQAAGLDAIGFGLGVAISDFDENGFLDIYVANDYFIPDFLYLNNGNQTFTEKLRNKTVHTSYYSMGCDAADFNNDGLIDLAVVDMTPADHVRNKTLMASMNPKQFEYLTKTQKFTPQYMFNSLQLNRGHGLMSEIGLMAGVAQTDWSWAALLVDFDNDGFKDFLVTNGYLRDTKNNDWRMALKNRRANEGDHPEVYFDQLQKADSHPVPNYIFQNNGPLRNGLTFSDKSEEWGLGSPSFSNGAAYGDLDQDGDLDLIVNNIDQKAFVYKNNTREKNNTNFIQFRLQDKTKPNSVLNARITIFYGDKLQTQEYIFTRGYQSCMESIAHFGLGNIEKVDRVEIQWLDESLSIINQPQINKLHRLERSKLDISRKEKKTSKPLFIDVTRQQTALTFKHQENDYNDFEKEILLPHRQSQLGPALAVGDFNGDNLDDFYIGGAKDQPGALYWQDQGGMFYPLLQAVFQKDAAYEDLGALFFDADGDQDLDLYVCSGGGGDLEPNSPLLQDRLYLNLGNGQFEKTTSYLPVIKSSTKAVSACDWDLDGDLDLFVGGRTTPGRYPYPPESFLLRNDNDRFINATEELAPGLQNIGMVTASCWSDLNQDGRMDLVLVGEWMAPVILQNLENGFVDVTEKSNLAEHKGWWYSINKADFDQDGDEDFILGNLGLNNKFHPSKEKPLYLYFNDYDENGSNDIVLSKFYKGQMVPVRGRECSSEQMPFLSDKFPTYASFATSNLEDIYGKEKISEALQMVATDFSSVYLENQGNLTFVVHPLPIEAQMGPINSVVIEDFDQDGVQDVIIAGGLFETEVETPSYDANHGLFLKGKDKGQFVALPHLDDSGIFLSRNVKDAQLIRLGLQNRPALIVANNNSNIQMLVYSH